LGGAEKIGIVTPCEQAKEIVKLKSFPEEVKAGSQDWG